MEEESYLLGRETQKPLHTWKTHVSVVIIYVCCVISSGPLTSFPTIENLLIGEGLFANFCNSSDNSTTSTGCQRQQAELGTLYNVSSGVSVGIFLFLGILYDKLGARWTATIGALGASVGLVILALSIKFRALNYLSYVGLTVSATMGGYNSLSLYGFIWHYPAQQAFIIGLSNSSSLMSALMADILLVFDKYNIKIVEGLLIFAVLSVISALLCWFFTPSPQEFYSRAEAVTGIKGPPESRSMIKDIKDCWSCIMAYKYDNLFYFLSGFVSYCYVIFWVGEFLPYELALLNNTDDANLLSGMFAVAFAILGALLSPFSGMILEKIGMANFYLSLTLSVLVFTIFLYIPMFGFQLISMICGITYVTVFSMFLGKWAVYYAPPELLGTFYGISFGSFGILQLAINTIITETIVAKGGLGAYIGPFIVFGILSISLQFAFYFWLKNHGVPTTPPTPGA